MYFLHKIRGPFWEPGQDNSPRERIETGACEVKDEAVLQVPDLIELALQNQARSTKCCSTVSGVQRAGFHVVPFDSYKPLVQAQAYARCAWKRSQCKDGRITILR